MQDLIDLKDNFKADALSEDFLKKNGFDDMLKGLQEAFNVRFVRYNLLFQFLMVFLQTMMQFDDHILAMSTSSCSRLQT